MGGASLSPRSDATEGEPEKENAIAGEKTGNLRTGSRRLLVNVVKAGAKRGSMAARSGNKTLVHLRTLFNVGAIGALSDGQLLERFSNGRGEARELAFAALVERHGAFVLRVCAAVLRDEHAAHDAFQATFLALARKAGSLWARDSLGPWLHQAAYRAACHDRSSTIRRRSHERAAATLRAEQVIPREQSDALEQIVHQEIDRLPGRFRVAVVLCELEGRTHEQAARHLGCAVGTVKSRLSRARKRLHAQLIRRGVAPAMVTAAAHAATAARAAVPAALAESTVIYAAAAGAVPASVTIITEGVLFAMFLNKLKLAASAVVAATALAAGAGALAQQEFRRTGQDLAPDQRHGSPVWTYQILASRDGEPMRKLAVVELNDEPIHINTPGREIILQPKRRNGAVERASRDSGFRTVFRGEGWCNRAGPRQAERGGSATGRC